MIHRITTTTIALFLGCSSCGPPISDNGDASSDVHIDVDGFVDVVDDSGTDPLNDSSQDPSSDASAENDPLPDVPLPCGLVIDGPTNDLSFLEEFEGLPRTPTMCGECCRQVTYSQNDLMLQEYDVWGPYLTMTTWDGIAPGVFRAILVDLRTLQHWLLEETDDRLSPENIDEGTMSAVLHDSNAIVQHIQYRSLESVAEATFRNVDFASSSIVIEWSSVYQSPGGIQPQDLAVSGEWLTWIDIRHPSVSGYQLYVYNTDTDTERHVVTTMPDCCVSQPRMHGSRVVYRDGKSNIHVYDVTTDTSTKVAGVDEWDWDRYAPAIWGDIVAWHDTRNGGTDASQTHTDIYMTNITEGGEQVVCDHPASQPAGVAVGDGFLVWPDLRNDPENPNSFAGATNIDLYLHDIETGLETQLTDLAGRKEYYPIIYRNRVYFIMEDDHGIKSIFEITLPEYEGADE